MDDGVEKINVQEKIKINRLIVLGDSLSDRGTMYKRMVGMFSGLWGKSPKGRFTDGLVWVDYLYNTLFSSDLAAVRRAALEIPQKKSAKYFSFNDDETIGIKTSPAILRSYCEGGATAHNYKRTIRLGMPYFNIEAQILANLDGKRQEALADDKYMGFNLNKTEEGKDTTNSAENYGAREKKETLVIEWTGANDLITVNPRPTIEAVNLAVDARIHNIEEMIKAGYVNFVLFNLPNLLLTPRYQNSADETLKQDAEACVVAFNQQLVERVTALQTQHPQCQIVVYDINKVFTNAYNNPSHYGLDATKLNQPYTTSGKDFNEGKDDGYMFWDPAHPMTTVHAVIAADFYENVFSKTYCFEVDQESYRNMIIQRYGLKLQKDKESVTGWFRHSRIPNYPTADLETLIRHGIYEKGYRMQGVLRDLGIIDSKNKPNNRHTLSSTLSVIEAAHISAKSTFFGGTSKATTQTAVSKVSESAVSDSDELRSVAPTAEAAKKRNWFSHNTFRPVDPKKPASDTANRSTETSGVALGSNGS